MRGWRRNRSVMSATPKDRIRQSLRAPRQRTVRNPKSKILMREFDEARGGWVEIGRAEDDALEAMRRGGGLIENREQVRVAGEITLASLRAHHEARRRERGANGGARREAKRSSYAVPRESHVCPK